MHRKFRLWLGLVGLLLAAIVGCGKGMMPGAAAQAQNKGPADPEVLVGRPTVETVTDYEDFTGHTEAVMSVEIRAG